MNKLKFINSAQLPVVYQSEASECGLVSILMIALYHGHELSLPSLRMKYESHSIGSRLTSLIDVATDLNFKTRAVRVELDELIKLSTPCILHWNLNHFVVLKKVKGNKYIIHDPALGRRIVSKDIMSNCFTGIALEISPNSFLRKIKDNQKINVSDMIKWMPDIRHPLLQLLLFSILLELISIASPLYMQFIIDGVLIDSDKDLLVTIIISSLAILLINVIVFSVRSWCTLVLSTTMNISWLRTIFHHLLSLPVSFFEKRQIGDVTSRFNSAASIQQTLTNYFIESFLDGVMAIGTLALMLVYSVKLTLITIFSIFTYTLLRLVWYRYLKDINEEQLVVSAKEDSHFIETLRGIHTIKSFRKECEREASWINIIVEQMNVNVKLEKLSILYRIISSLTSGVNQSCILWIGASLVMENTISIGMYMAYMAYSTQFSSRMSTLIDNIVSLKMIRLHLDRLSDILLTSPESSSECKIHDLETEFNIQFKNVFFRYSSTDEWLLENLSFEISQGEVVALTGVSGCGKSTILKLIMGHHYPQSGDILICGISTRHLNKHALRRIVSSVMQEDILFSGSVQDNIAFLDHEPNESAIIEAAKLACIDKKIDSLPMGYHTPIGEIGSFFSAGQQQRIILARALYVQPKIILLDEATSNLDSDTEEEVNGNINSMGITTVIVAHRKETIASAQRQIAI